MSGLEYPLSLSSRCAVLQVPRLCGTPGLLTLIVLQATLSGAFRDTAAVLRLAGPREGGGVESRKWGSGRWRLGGFGGVPVSAGKPRFLVKVT